MRRVALRRAGVWATLALTTVLVQSATNPGGGETPEPGPFDHLRFNFADYADDTDPETIGFTLYKPAAASVCTITGGRLRIEMENAGAGVDASWWYGTGPGFRNDGILLHVTVGPDAPVPTPIAFSLRTRIRVSNLAGDGPPPQAGGRWTFAGPAVHSPTRPGFAYVHFTAGTDPTEARGLEGKTNDFDVSLFPVVAAAGTGPILVDVRIDRDPVNPQILRGYFRVTDPEVPLDSDDGWELHTEIHRDDASLPLRDDAEPLPDTVQLGIINYSNNSTDCRIEVDEFNVYELAA